ncbi:hypothetical protein [Gemmobacter sp. LW-1]|uniref:hypothetical protein n=1 Tax=Gemmobacter sp. LW-1 TaxID=1529005 RepID=UPI0006C742A8|nr:hypothetical protein [Gemmobacter sp. LW-1]
MTNPKDPVGGVQLNDITIIRNRRLTEAEQAMAEELMRCGTPRWRAAAMLGTHPLNINRADNLAPRRTRATGRLLSTTAASRDIRQLRMQGLD